MHSSISHGSRSTNEGFIGKIIAVMIVGTPYLLPSYGPRYAFDLVMYFCSCKVYTRLYSLARSRDLCLFGTSTGIAVSVTVSALERPIFPEHIGVEWIRLPFCHVKRDCPSRFAPTIHVPDDGLLVVSAIHHNLQAIRPQVALRLHLHSTRVAAFLPHISYEPIPISEYVMLSRAPYQ